jgi:Glycosyl transferases group 1
MKLYYRVVGYYSTHGLRPTIQRALGVLLIFVRVAVRQLMPGQRKFVIVSHQLDTSGAPHIALGVIEDFARHVGAGAVRVITFEPVSGENVARLTRNSIQVDIYPSALAASVRVVRGDFVLLNSTAIPVPFLQYVLRLAERGRLEHLHWYCHEDEPERVFKPALEERVRALLAQGRLTLWVGGLKACRNYQHYFGHDQHIRYLAYRIEVDKPYWAPKRPEEFGTIRFQMSASIGQCGKGQFGVLIAFQELVSRGRTGAYRPFELQFNGIEEGTINARHLVECGEAVLGARFKHSRRLALSDSFSRTQACQVVICYSVTECFSLAVMESMAMGQVVLRNGCSGIDEQLAEGENGFYVQSGNLHQFADVLERILDPSQLSNEDLWRMGVKSQEMAQAFAQLDYYERITSASGNRI